VLVRVTAICPNCHSEALSGSQRWTRCVTFRKPQRWSWARLLWPKQRPELFARGRRQGVGAAFAAWPGGVSRAPSKGLCETLIEERWLYLRSMPRRTANGLKRSS